VTTAKKSFPKLPPNREWGKRQLIRSHFLNTYSFVILIQLKILLFVMEKRSKRSLSTMMQKSQLSAPLLTQEKIKKKSINVLLIVVTLQTSLRRFFSIDCYISSLADKNLELLAIKKYNRPTS
jgi:hypothetical protein